MVTKRAAEAAPSVPARRLSSRRIIAELHRPRPRAVVGLDVDQGHAPGINLLLRALQCRADVLRVLDVFAVATEPFGHLVVAGVAEVAAGLVALRVGGPRA